MNVEAEDNSPCTSQKGVLQDRWVVGALGFMIGKGRMEFAGLKSKIYNSNTKKNMQWH